MAHISEVGAPAFETWGRARVVVEGQDVSYLTDRRGREHATIVPLISLTDPYTYESASFILPGFDPHKDRPGVGRFAMIRKDAGVRIDVVGDDDPGEDDVEVPFRGNISSWRASARGLEVTVEGRLMGLASQIVPPDPGFVERERSEDFIKRIMDGGRGDRFLPLRFDPASVPTGVFYSSRGDYSSRLSLVTDALAACARADGTTYTVRYDEIAGPEFTEQTARNTWTATFEQPGMQADLLVDHRATVHAIYGRGVSPNGGEWRNTKYPDAKASTAPAYPAGSTTYGPGSGMPRNVAERFWARMRDLGYRIASGTTGYDAADEDEVRDLQEDQGILVDGRIGPQTWAAAFMPGLEASVGDAIILPLATAPEWGRDRYNAAGAVVGENPDYDPGLVPQEREVDFGEGITIKDARKSARQMIRREREPLISGTITLTADPRQGSRFRIRPTDRFRVLNYMGEDVEFHIARAEYDFQGLRVTLTVSTRKGTYATIADEIAQRRTERQSRRQANGKPIRQSGVIWDSESPAGRIARTSHFGGLASVTYVPVPVYGTVVKSRIECSEPSEFIAAVFNKPVTPAQIEGIIGANPLEITEREPTDGYRKALREAGLVIWWGSATNPLGYGDEYKPDDIIRATELLDGTFVEEAQWEYRIPPGGKPYLTLITWTRESVHTTGRFLPGVREL